MRKLALTVAALGTALATATAVPALADQPTTPAPRALDFNVTSELPQPAEYNLFFDGYATTLDTAGREVISLIADHANDVMARRIEVVANPDGDFQGDLGRDTMRASWVHLQLLKQDLPLGTRVTVSVVRGSETPKAGSAPLLATEQRVAVIVHPRYETGPQVSMNRVR